MSKRMIPWLVFTMFTLQAACGKLTSSDDDDMRPLVAAVGKLPPAEMKYLEAAKDLDALEVIKNANPDRPTADVACSSGQNYKMTVKMLYYFMKDFLDAISPGTPSFDPSIAQMSFWEYLDNKLAQQGCRADFHPYTDFTHDWHTEQPKPGSDKANRGIADWLVGLKADYIMQHPVIMTILGLTVAGGVLVVSVGNPISMLFCAMSEAVKCPDGPLPVDGTSTSSGGDHL